MIRRSAMTAFAVCLILTAAGQARAAETPVDLELVIAVDVSWSVDEDEARLQREGYVSAFTNEQVIQAIQSGFLGRVAVLYYEWAGMGWNQIVQNWTVIEDAATAKAFAARLREHGYETGRRTSISQALDFAVPLFENNGYVGKRRVIDVSGDGPNNWGRLVNKARDDAVAAGVTINGLPILSSGPEWNNRWWLADLDLYYENCVIGGRGSFVVVANGFTDFADAVRRKLVLEIAGLDPASPAGRQADRVEVAMAGASDGEALLAQAASDNRIAPPCDIGERRRRLRMMQDEDAF